MYLLQNFDTLLLFSMVFSCNYFDNGGKLHHPKWLVLILSPFRWSSTFSQLCDNIPISFDPLLALVWFGGEGTWICMNLWMTELWLLGLFGILSLFGGNFTSNSGRTSLCTSTSSLLWRSCSCSSSLLRSKQVVRSLWLSVKNIQIIGVLSSRPGLISLKMHARSFKTLFSSLCSRKYGSCSKCSLKLP